MVMQDEQGRYRVENLRDAKPYSTAVIEDFTLYLFTKENLEKPHAIRLDSFEDLTSSSLYDVSRKNAFLFHGWTGTENSTYINRIRKALLEKFDMNVFTVDWSRPAGLSYMDAVKEVVPSAEFIGNFAKQMMEHYEISGNDFILIGHSLGGQIVGALGAQLNGEVETIIALDPAGPLFSLEDTDLSLDITDGKFVHAIHTNTAFLGFLYPCAHADFYPNGGVKQNGCGIDGTGTCSHGRANDYYVESIMTGGFKAVKCDSYEDFQAGLCNDNESSYIGREPVDKS